MKLKHVYLTFCAIGTVLPLTQVVPFFIEEGPDATRFIELLFANPVSGFFGMDVLVSSLVLWVFVLTEGRRVGVGRLWAPIVGNLTVGVSLGLPLFLFLRERRLERP